MKKQTISKHGNKCLYYRVFEYKFILLHTLFLRFFSFFALPFFVQSNNKWNTIILQSIENQLQSNKKGVKNEKNCIFNKKIIVFLHFSRFWYLVLCAACSFNRIENRERKIEKKENRSFFFIVSTRFVQFATLIASILSICNRSD